MNNDKLYVRQICFLFGAFLLPIKLITMPALAAKAAAEALWLPAAINFVFDGLMVFFILYMANKFEGMTIFEIVETNFGNAGKFIFSFAFLLFFISKSYIPLVEHRNFIEVALYETTPALWIFLPVFIFSAFFSYKGLRGAARTADVTIWFTAVGIIILMSLSVASSDFSNLFPLIDVPFKSIAKGSRDVSLWFFDSPYLLFCLGHFKPEKKQTAKIAGAYFGFAAIAIVYMLILQCEFGNLTERQFFSPIKMGKFNVSSANIGRVDYIAVSAIIFSCVFGCALPLVFATICLEKCFPFKHKFLPCVIVNAFMGITVMFTDNYYFTARQIFRDYITPIFVCFSLLPLISVFLKSDKTKKEGLCAL